MILPSPPIPKIIETFEGVILNTDDISFIMPNANGTWNVTFKNGNVITVSYNFRSTFGFIKEREPTEWEDRLCAFLGSTVYRYKSKGGTVDWIGYPIGEFMQVKTRGNWDRKMMKDRKKIHAEIQRLIVEGFLIVDGDKIKVRT